VGFFASEEVIMELALGWREIALRLLLASVASFLIGYDRDEHGHPAGVRTTMLVCLAAALAMVQVNLLLPLAGRRPDSFVAMDLMRLPLGILSGIGFIGAGVIMKREKEQLVTGVTTAATMWYVTVLGLLYGGGQIRLALAASAIALGVLWGVKRMRGLMSHEFHGRVHMVLAKEGPTEDELREMLLASSCRISRWTTVYTQVNRLESVACEVRWLAKRSRIPETPSGIRELRELAGVEKLTWDE
jgi:putative Mg2+ transporter-C (MgtC) family protein